MVDIGAFGGPALRAGVPPFHVMDVLSAAQARQRSHGDLVSLAAGQPSAPAPEAVRRAAKEALDKYTLGYTEQLGIPELREAVAGHYRKTYDVDVTAQDVVMTTGSSGGFLLSFLSAFDPGARVAMARPGYPAYRNLLKVLGCEVVEFATTAETNFQPTVDLLDELGPLDGLIVASPSNPTGTVLPPGELAAISGWCASHGVQLISDEIYHGISYEKQLDCAWQYGREALVLGSFSKYFAMTGWRLGWMLVPQQLHRAVDVLTGNFTICPPAIAQHAAVAAFTPESYAEADAHVDHYRRNRDRLFAGLKKIGLDKLAPAEGAFYAYADVSAYTTDSLSWCQRLLADTGVAIAPGVDFDPVDGGKFVRFSFAGATEDVDEGVRRLGEWLR
ncbi:aminotransferase class I/II-fold pyridoxal phosphate-dependent enzyme [Amycolatopsis carbonis]|uniref:Aminotransferase n=1 Tax=Amycolatopsis carbonis TaxID=715471 RepID=A0A9Y2IKS4_9PSEU|nr:aminotransferase class I/II-fold pyridoxal phosphate-dependent enzyme [Amycolatopsis sp. 2-15]WIX80985.1 aminotransferase class I/II-fold pyridoxal phosphate-dependent enzyme [Amycolatopsis sp. 2-15]